MKSHDINNKREQVIALRQGGASVEIRKDYWSEDDREQLKMMFFDGYDITDMALRFRRSEIAIYAQLNAMGVFNRARAARQKDSKCLCPKCERYPDCTKCQKRERAN